MSGIKEFVMARIPKRKHTSELRMKDHTRKRFWMCDLEVCDADVVRIIQCEGSYRQLHILSVVTGGEVLIVSIGKVPQRKGNSNG